VYPTIRTPIRANAGISLVEIMVGLAIGMIGMLVMLQVFSASEQSRRITTGGNDAQNNAIVALNGIQRDLRQAGHDFAVTDLLGCGVVMPGGWTVNSLAPVVINPTGTGGIPAGDPNTDIIMVAYGTSSSSSTLGDGIIAQDRTAYTYKPKTPTSFAIGDRLIAAPKNRSFPTCAMTIETVRDISPAPPQAPLTLTVSGDVGARANGNLFNVGPDPKILVYAVRNAHLTVCDFTARNCSDATRTSDSTYWVPIADNIVSLRAQYGRDGRTATAIATSGDNNYVVNTYDQTTPTADTATNSCQWAKIATVRLALVGRSGQYDKLAVTTAAPTWLGSGTAPIDLSRNPDGSTNPDWTHYRYKTFQVVAPLRNIAWMGVQGC
jgi:type IV pilus assembly protein PilW